MRKLPVLLVIGVLLAGPAFADEVVVPIPETSKVVSLMDVTHRARTLLNERLLERAKQQPVPTKVANKDVSVDVVLAIWNRADDTIKLFDATKTNTKLSFKDPTAPKVTILVDNGVNSQYKVLPEGAALVAGGIFPTFTEITEKKKKSYELHDRVYIPYQKDFYTTEVLSYGSDYLSRLIKDAYDDLRAKGVKSKAFPDKLLADVVDPYLVKTIAMIEHSGLSLLSKEEPERAVGRFLVTLAQNGDDAFDYSVSSTGARGLVQFMPQTYSSIVAKKPQLGLIEDFKLGMTNHVNAVKAQIALLDDDLAAMPKDVKEMYLANPAEGARFLAAAYNGGGARVRKAFAAWGKGWADPKEQERIELGNRLQQIATDLLLWKRQLKKRATMTKGQIVYTERAIARETKEQAELRPKYEAAKAGGLRNETVGYVRKFDRVFAMLQGGMFSTPNTKLAER